ncbi:hypothetical protein GCM10008944_04330 [Cytobacillus oceanisediminis]
MNGMSRGLATAVLLLAVGCSSGPTSVIGLDLVCDQDRSSAQAKDVVERVGGLRTDDFLVRLARSTEVGVVALVDGDVQDAYTVLHGDYGVSVVAQVADDGQGTADGLAQVDRITRAACEGS